MTSIDLNADLGEGGDDDEGLMAVITSANIACGGHAGDKTSMRVALRLAKANGVAAGAHPAYPDRENFGRRSIAMEPDELAASLKAQISALAATADDEGMSLSHVKPHGALYNDVAKDAVLAEAVVTAISEVAPGLPVFGLPGSEIESAVHKAGLAFIAEGFADRAYTAGGRLVPRTEPGSFIEEESDRIAQALAFAQRQTVTAQTGEEISIPVQTICLHGDSPGALESARAIREALQTSGINVRAVP